MRLSLIELQVKLQYQLLRHEGFYTRVASLDHREQDEKKNWREDLVRGCDQLISWASSYCGKRSLYLSQNPFNKDGSVYGISCFTVDADPIRDPKRASLSTEHAAAIKVATKISYQECGS